MEKQVLKAILLLALQAVASTMAIPSTATACTGENSLSMSGLGQCEDSLERIKTLTMYVSDTNATELTDIDVVCLIYLETNGIMENLEDSLVKSLDAIVHSCDVIANVSSVASMAAILSPYANHTDDITRGALLRVVDFAASVGISTAGSFASSPADGIQFATNVFATLGSVLDVITNISLPSSGGASKVLEDAGVTLNCSAPASSVTFTQAQKIIADRVSAGGTLTSMLEDFVLPLQLLIPTPIHIDRPPFYIHTERTQLINLIGKTYMSPYGGISVDSASSVNSSILTITDNLVVMFTGLGVNILGGNASSSGMDNTVVRLDLFSLSGDKLNHLVDVQAEIEIKTKEDKILSETQCSTATKNCPNSTSEDSIAAVNKESKSVYYLWKGSKTMRLDVDRNESYTIFLSKSDTPSSNTYELMVERDDDSNVWIDEGIDSVPEDGADTNENTEPSWSLDVKIESQKLFMFFGIGNVGDNSTTVEVVIQQIQKPGEGDSCDYITPNMANIDIVNMQDLKSGFAPSKAAVSPDSTKEKTKFKSNFLGTFTVDLFYPPNTIEFSTVFDDFAAKIAENWLVLATTVSMLGLSVILGIWMRWLDKRDTFMWDFKHLKDNAAWHTHSYKMSIQTGSKGVSLPDNVNVNMKVIGENGFSGPRVLDDGVRKNFQRGRLSNFVMTTFGDLGQLKSLEIWAEPLERREKPSAIQNRSLNSNSNNNCGGDDNLNCNNNNSNSCSNNIFGTDNEMKGKSKRIHIEKISIADVKNSQRYFFNCDCLVDTDGRGTRNRSTPVATENSVKNFWYLFNNHTRQGMFEDHLWFSTFKRPSLSHFTRLQRLGCCLSALFLTMVGSCMWYKTEEDAPNIGVDLGPIRLTWHSVYTGTLVTLMVLPVNMVVVYVFQKVKAKDDDLDQKPTGKKRCELPRWFLIPAWIVCVLSILLSAFFTFLYSMEWGSTVANQWLVSQIVGTLENILLFQSIKVLLLAIFFAAVLRMPSDPVDTRDVTTPVWTQPEDPEKVKRTAYLDKKMFVTIRNIVLFLAYLILLLFIGLSAIDPRGFYQNLYIRGTLVPKTMSQKLFKIERYEDIYQWLSDVVIPYSTLKTSLAGPFGYSEVDDDLYQLGPLRLKQVRHPTGRCQLHDTVAHVIEQCNGKSASFEEDKSHYGKGWTSYRPEVNISEEQNYFTYQSAGQLKAIPETGDFSSYSGGGYVAALSMDYNESMGILKQLHTMEWLDKQTKALIVEMNTFNGNINLFTMVKLVCERTDLGRFFVRSKLRSFRLYTYVGHSAILVISCQALWTILLLYFIVCEIRAIKTNGCKHLKNLWNCVHIIHLILAVASIVLFLARIPFIMTAVERVHNEHGTFVSFDALAFWDEAFTITLSFVLFLGCLEMLSFFRFIKQLAFFIATIRYSVQKLVAYSVVFGVAFWGYAILGFLWLGVRLQSFCSIFTSVETLMSTMLGKMSKDLVSFENDTMGSIYFMTYVIVIGFILVDMFITILNEAFEYIRQHPELSVYDAELSKHMSARFAELWRPVFGRKDKSSVEKKLKLEKSEEVLVGRLDKLCGDLDSNHQLNWDRFVMTTCQILKTRKEMEIEAEQSCQTKYNHRLFLEECGQDRPDKKRADLCLVLDETPYYLAKRHFLPKNRPYNI